MKSFWLGVLFTVAFLTFSLAACKQSDTAADGYVFEKGTESIGHREIKVVQYPSFEALRDSYNKQPGARQIGATESLQAFSAYNDKTCTIHMIDPAVHYQPEFFGHELVHCLYGNFHPTQDKR